MNYIIQYDVLTIIYVMLNLPTVYMIGNLYYFKQGKI